MNTAARMSLIGSLMLCAVLTSTVQARAESMNVVYINGINNTLTDAYKTRKKIQEVLDDSTNHSGQNKRSFFVGFIWNPVGWNGTKEGPNLDQDQKELFLLKSAEELFAADFSKILAPFNGPVVAIDKEVAAIIASEFLDDMTPGHTSLEVGNNPVNDDDMDRTKKATVALAAKVKLLTKPVIVVAHSQGNLLANLAYASLASEYGDDLFKMLRVVNVANTTQFAVSNLNFTHAGDAALFSSASATPPGDQSLQTLPVRKNWTRWPAPGNLDVADFSMMPATFERQDDIDWQWGFDVFLDHSITGTYLSNAEVTPNSNASAAIFTPNANRFVDRFEDFVYAAANSFLTTCNAQLHETIRPEDVVCVGGKTQWLQPQLFSGLSWNQIKSACSGENGLCSDGVELNGHVMTGWKWASISDLNNLFNSYGVLPSFGTEADVRTYPDHQSPSVDAFVANGWLATDADRLSGGSWYEFYTGHLSNDLSPYAGACGGVLDQKRQNSDEMYTTCNVSKGKEYPRFGAWFYRVQP